MSFYRWHHNIFFKKLPASDIIINRGKRSWDLDEQKLALLERSANKEIVFTMPSFGRHGRWGNIVFQYLFIRILALKNNGKVELYRGEDSIQQSMCLYEDMVDVPNIQTRCSMMVLDNYYIYRDSLRYIPGFGWRALYASLVRLQECFIFLNSANTIDKLSLQNGATVEVEGLFWINPIAYKQDKEFILNHLFRPSIELASFIQTCLNKLGENKTIVGIHIRRGDFVEGPLDQFFQFPISVKYVITWLTLHVSSLKNPVILVCSDDPNAYKEIEVAGFEVFTIKKLFPEGELPFKEEHIDWEVLRQCDILLTSNSTFGFSAALLNTQNATCYHFSLSQKAFISFDPWNSEPLQSYKSSPYLWSYLYSRFSLVSTMVSRRKAFRRLKNDLKSWIKWKRTRTKCFYHIYGFSLKFFGKLFNPTELFRHNANDLDDILGSKS